MSLGPCPRPQRLTALAWLCTGLLSPLACGEDVPQSSCLAELSNACAPLYDPTFDEIHRRLLVPSCAVSGGGCHASDGRAAGLRLDDPEVAYAALVSGGAPRVKPGDAACSVLYQRLEGSPSVMPPGAPISEAERCVVRRWIEQGAPR